MESFNDDEQRWYDKIVHDLDEIHNELTKREGNKPSDPKKLKRWEVEVRARLWGSVDGPKFGVVTFSSMMVTIERLIRKKKFAKKLIIDLLEKSKNSTAPYILKVIREVKFKMI
jgi:hypothetical protein